ncbi:MAG: PorT family protein [Bacteroidaceae bacterium]|nr:PorT family protein [Bacteroidaceae bacterium]
MKRIVSVTLTLVMAMMVSIPASAVRWGIRGGLNLVDNNLNNISLNTVKDKDSYTGFFAGPVAQMKLPLGFGIDVSAMYSQKGINIASGETVKEQAIAIPLMARWQFNLGKVLGIFAQLGPQVNFNLGDLATAVKDWEASFVLNRCVWNFDFGAGVELFSHLQVAVNYNLPLSDDGTFFNSLTAGIGNRETIDESFKSSTLQLMLTYKF